MGKRGFSATTAVLVAVLIGALYMVGRTVTPPPPGPPEPPPSAKLSTDPHAAPSKNDPKLDMAAKMKHMMADKQRDEIKKHQYVKAHMKKFDPNTIEIQPGWTADREMGKSGEEKMQEKVKEAKAADEAERMHPTPAQPGQPAQSAPLPAK